MKASKFKQIKHVTSCGCCIFREGASGPEILLVRPFESNDVWGFPKGHMEPGETHEETALRETLEETGLNAVLLERLPPALAVYDNERKTVIGYLATLLDPEQEITGDGENFMISWHHVDELPRIHRYQQNVIALAVEKIKERTSD